MDPWLEPVVASGGLMQVYKLAFHGTKYSITVNVQDDVLTIEVEQEKRHAGGAANSPAPTSRISRARWVPAHTKETRGDHSRLNIHCLYVVAVKNVPLDWEFWAFLKLCAHAHHGAQHWLRLGLRRPPHLPGSEHSVLESSARRFVCMLITFNRSRA